MNLSGAWKTFVIIIILGLTEPETAPALECNICHSKNPMMVKMHRATKEKDINCFDCHRIGEKLMGKSTPKDMASLLQRRIADKACTGCHG